MDRQWIARLRNWAVTKGGGPILLQRRPTALASIEWDMQMTDRRHIVLISCVKSKQTKPAPAGELYTSTWFRSALAYARSSSPDVILILSAKHGILGLDQTVAPYDSTLSNAGVSTRRQWAQSVRLRLPNESSQFDSSPDYVFGRDTWATGDLVNLDLAA